VELITRPRSHYSSQVVRGYDELAPYSLALTALLDVVDAPATARWHPLMTWLQHNPDVAPWSFLVWRDGRLVAAALLVRRRVGVVMQISTMGEDHLPSWLPVIDAESADQLSRAIADELGSIRSPWMLRLGTLEADDLVAERLAVDLGRVYTTSDGAPRLEFADDVALNSYISRNTRSAEAKARNRIKNSGLVVDMQWTKDPTEIEAAIPEVVELQRRRSRQMNQSVQLEDDTYRDFYIAMMQA
jgi:hypothetical protein